MTLRFIARAKRRNAGVYWYRTDKHLRAGRESGYVGESQDLDARHAQHVQGGGRYDSVAKDWADLNPVRYAVQFPWWLSWKWVLRSVETVAIPVLRPRYNWAKNPWKRHRVGPAGQAVQRQVRDARRAAGKPLHNGATNGGQVLALLGLLLIAVGVLGKVITQ